MTSKSARLGYQSIDEPSSELHQVRVRPLVVLIRVLGLLHRLFIRPGVQALFSSGLERLKVGAGDLGAEEVAGGRAGQQGTGWRGEGSILEVLEPRLLVVLLEPSKLICGSKSVRQALPPRERPSQARDSRWMS